MIQAARWHLPREVSAKRAGVLPLLAADLTPPQKHGRMELLRKRMEAHICSIPTSMGENAAIGELEATSWALLSNGCASSTLLEAHIEADASDYAQITVGATHIVRGAHRDNILMSAWQRSFIYREI